ncbi:ABC transporter transmembrane domain-containing protein [Gammaproteobacteria bacterium]|nr:ABC transporter transmembrane domain-containing protein [Gammaproteobacteria bacterium]
MKNRFASYHLLWPLLEPFKWKMLQAMCALLAASGFTLLLPILMNHIVSAALISDLVQLQYGFMGLLLASIGLGFFSAYRFYLVSWLGERVVLALREKLFSHLTQLPAAFYDDHLVGELTSRLTTDTTLVEQVVGTSFSMAIRNLILLLGSLVFILFTSAYLTFMLLIITPVVVFPLIFLARRYRLLSKESQHYVADANAYANGILSMMDTVRAYQFENKAYQHFTTILDSGFEVSKRRIWARAQLTMVMSVVIISGMVAVLWLGTLEVFQGGSNLSPGDIGQFFGYAIYIAVAVAALAEVWGDLMRASGALSRSIDLLEKPIATHSGHKQVKNCDIEFDKISFSYPLRSHIQVLSNVSFKANAREVTALVGISGSGKSTLLKLLMGNYADYRGEIRVGGCAIKEIDIAKLRASIAVVSHQVGIFPTSIRENMTMGMTATDEEIFSVAKLASIDEFIHSLPDGLDTMVGERGVMLSEGQRQRIALARAILRDAEIILLDEATNALDAITEEAINHAMKHSFADKTILVIAHRLATVKDAHQIVMLDHGEVLAQGTHQQLLKQSDLYRQLADIQMVIS